MVTIMQQKSEAAKIYGIGSFRRQLLYLHRREGGSDGAEVGGGVTYLLTDLEEMREGKVREVLHVQLACAATHSDREALEAETVQVQIMS